MRIKVKWKSFWQYDDERIETDYFNVDDHYGAVNVTDNGDLVIIEQDHMMPRCFANGTWLECQPVDSE